jgi:coenzyme PQQ biosynthesis protein PqqD
MTMRRPQLVRHARYRHDALRGQHQLVYPEGVLVLNESGAAIVQRCDGRPLEDVLAGLTAEFAGAAARQDVVEFLERLAQKGLLRDAGDDA